MTRIGIAGCGFIGMVHAWALRALERAGLTDLRIAAVHDARPERAADFAQIHEAEAVGDLGSLLDACDVVWICTWTAGHLEVAEAAAERGKPVFCEKPLAPSLEECEAVAAALRRVPHQVGLVLRYAPVFRMLEDAVRLGRHGRAMTALMRDDQFFPIQGMYASTWRADVSAAGGGTLIEHSIHDVDVLRWLLGDPAEVSGRTASFFGHTGIEDLAGVTLSYADGRLATLSSVWHQVLSRGSSRRLEVFCEDAYLWTEDDYLGPLHVETSAGEEVVEGEPEPWVPGLELPEPIRLQLALYATQAKAFLDSLASGAKPSPDVEVALAAHRLVDAAYRSAAAGGVPVAP